MWSNTQNIYQPNAYLPITTFNSTNECLCNKND